MAYDDFQNTAAICIIKNTYYKAQLAKVLILHYIIQELQHKTGATLHDNPILVCIQSVTPPARSRHYCSANHRPLVQHTGVRKNLQDERKKDS